MNSKDEGWYDCQVNTEPKINFKSYLKVMPKRHTSLYPSASTSSDRSLQDAPDSRPKVRSRKSREDNTSFSTIISRYTELKCRRYLGRKLYRSYILSIGELTTKDCALATQILSVLTKHSPVTQLCLLGNLPLGKVSLVCNLCCIS